MNTQFLADSVPTLPQVRCHTQAIDSIRIFHRTANCHIVTQIVIVCRFLSKSYTCQVCFTFDHSPTFAAFSSIFAEVYLSQFYTLILPCPGQQYLLCCARCWVHNAAPCALCRSGLRGLVQTGTRGGGQKGRRGQGDRWTIAEVYFCGGGSSLAPGPLGWAP